MMQQQHLQCHGNQKEPCHDAKAKQTIPQLCGNKKCHNTVAATKKHAMMPQHQKQMLQYCSNKNKCMATQTIYGNTNHLQQLNNNKPGHDAKATKLKREQCCNAMAKQTMLQRRKKEACCDAMATKKKHTTKPRQNKPFCDFCGNQKRP